MGADIHIYAERMLRDGTWATCSTFDFIDKTALRNIYVAPNDDTKYESPWVAPRVTQRNYEFFAALAGVRGDGPEPRGLPDDVAPLTEDMSIGYGMDGHSHSWHRASEFVPIFMEHQMTDEEKVHVVAHNLEGHYGTSIVAQVMGKYIGINVDSDAENFDNYRFVYWFDN